MACNQLHLQSESHFCMDKIDRRTSESIELLFTWDEAFLQTSLQSLDLVTEFSIQHVGSVT